MESVQLITLTLFSILISGLAVNCKVINSFEDDKRRERLKALTHQGNKSSMQQRYAVFLKKLHKFRQLKEEKQAGGLVKREETNDFKKTWCQRRYVPVKLPPPDVGAYFPDCAMLWQCTGCCGAGEDITCMPSATETKIITVYHYSLFADFVDRMVNVSISSHTSCKCDCTVQAHHCDETYEVYDQEYCECMCKDRSDTCDPKIKVWNQGLCACECKEDLKACPNDMEWDIDVCQCRCPQFNRDKCASRNQRINENTCVCY